MDDLKKRSTAQLSKEELEKLDKSLKEEGDGTRLTRQKAHQIASGTHLFKLGMDNNFKSYVNQYSTNPIALNKAQRNEERDKKRHLSHKFSLTQASEFKWVGSLTGTPCPASQHAPPDDSSAGKQHSSAVHAHQLASPPQTLDHGGGCLRESQGFRARPYRTAGVHQVGGVRERVARSARACEIAESDCPRAGREEAPG